MGWLCIMRLLLVCLKNPNHVFFLLNRMKPRKVKEDDAPRTIACPHKVSLTTACQHFAKIMKFIVMIDFMVLHCCCFVFWVIGIFCKGYLKVKKALKCIDFHVLTRRIEPDLNSACLANVKAFICCLSSLPLECEAVNSTLPLQGRVQAPQRLFRIQTWLKEIIQNAEDTWHLCLCTRKQKAFWCTASEFTSQLQRTLHYLLVCAVCQPCAALSPVPRAAQRCSGITQPWGSISTPTDPACTSAPSAARRSSRAPNSNVTNLFTRGRNPSRLASGLHTPPLTDTLALFLHFKHISPSQF